MSFGRYSPDIKLMQETARNSEMHHQHCAMFLDIKISGYNRYNRYSNTTSIHAETVAINNFVFYYRKKGYKDEQIRRKLKKHSLLIIRINNDVDKAKKQPCRYSMPCTDCINNLNTHGIKQIIITTDDGKLESIRKNNYGDGIASSGRRYINTLNTLKASK